MLLLLGAVAGAIHRSCWLSPESTNLASGPHAVGLDARCRVRHGDLSAAQQACEQMAWCGGVTQDGGLFCGGSSRLLYELRAPNRIESPGSGIRSWLRGTRTTDGGCAPSPRRSERDASVLEWRTGAAEGDVDPAMAAGRLSAIQVARALALRSRSPGRFRTRSHCVGGCCATPLHRNRTCAFQDLLFRPPSSFHFVTDDAIVGEGTDHSPRGTRAGVRWGGGGG